MAATSLPAFEAKPIPRICLGDEEVEILHPGYPEPANLLFKLPCVDRDATTDVAGVYHATALLACQIIAGNTFDTGRLTLDKEGRQPINISLNEILPGGSYYFFLGDDPGMSIALFLMII